MKMNKRIVVLLDERTDVEVEKMASERGMSKSGWVRMLIMREIGRKKK